MRDSALIGPVEAPDLQVMTFNIRRRMPLDPRPADSWSRREPAVAAVLEEARPTLLGVQEALPGQAAAVKRALGRGYRMLGHGRNADGRGEGTPLFFDSTRLRLLEWQQLAVSATPDVPGSRTWGNRTPRMLVRALFLDRVTSARFIMINTHLDNASRRSRFEGARMLRQRAESDGLPTIITGDFNSGEGTEPLDELFSDGALVDAWHAAARRLSPLWGTFENYRDPRPHRKRIDWIVVSAAIEVSAVQIGVRRPKGVWPSDHLPVQAVVRIPAPDAV
ncbi:endonuclease [Cnuibacter physcomitrellae]|nr:endonuclease/exonuclease/phosphatase family protein [Cnuibacter physcomitrellae]GGI40095.1 endonuclease [Cnuibacter physcomitrellae]